MAKKKTEQQFIKRALPRTSDDLLGGKKELRAVDIYCAILKKSTLVYIKYAGKQLSAGADIYLPKRKEIHLNWLVWK